MATAGDIINGSLRLIGQLAEGEAPSADTAQDALAAMNQMIDSWNTERLAVFTTQTQEFTWPPGQATRTIGPTGNFVGDRPVLVDDATYFKDTQSGLSYGIKIINQDQYNGIALKTSSSSYPQVMYVRDSYPDVTLTVYPVPTKPLLWYIVSMQPLTQPATLGTNLAFPPGYLRAFRYNLASELAPEFGVEPTPQVMRIAMTSKRNLKRINNPGDIMAMPYPIIARRHRFNIFTGNPG
jgi:hypothetical protein